MESAEALNDTAPIPLYMKPLYHRTWTLMRIQENCNQKVEDGLLIIVFHLF